MLHIRLRVRAPDQQRLSQAQTILTTELNRLKQSNLIADHYPGSHGTPGSVYAGEAGGFDENRTNPKGWRTTQAWLQAASEVALLIIEGRIGQLQLGGRFHFNDHIHFFCNQMGKPESILPISAQAKLFT